MQRPLVYLEGLGHGPRSVLRKALTDFGSPWRGLFRMTPSMEDLFGSSLLGLLATDQILQHGHLFPQDPDTVRLLHQMRTFRQETGLSPILVSERKFRLLQESTGRAYAFSRLKSMLRHERIHQQAYAQAGSILGMADAHRQALRSGGGVIAGFRKGAAEIAEDTLRSLGFEIDEEVIQAAQPAATRNLLRQYYHAAVQSHAALPEEEAARYLSTSPFRRKTLKATYTRAMLSHEALAYMYQRDRSFFARMRSQGLADPRTVHARSMMPPRKIRPKALLPPASPMPEGRIQANAAVNAIEGMAKPGTVSKGSASIIQRLRRLLTSFGSPWRGIASVEHDLISRMFGSDTLAVTVPLSELDQVIRRSAPDTARRLEQLRQWSQQTGYWPILVSKDVHPSALRQVIRHERIHQQISRHASEFSLHPVHAALLERQGGVVKSFVYGLKNFQPELSAEQAIQQAREYIERYSGHIRSHLRRNLLFGKQAQRIADYHLSEEALAYRNMAEKGFFQAMESLGLPDPRKAALRWLQQSATVQLQTAIERTAAAQAVAQTTRSQGRISRLASILRNLL